MRKTHKDVRDISQGGTGVPVPTYLLTFKGETLRVVTRMIEALEWLRHPYRQSPQYACYVLIDGEQREVCRNR